MKVLIYISLFICFFSTAQTNHVGVTESEYDIVSVPEYIAPPKSAETKIFEVVDLLPEFPEGNKYMSKYLVKHKMYPVLAKEAGIEGVCYVNCIITTKGEITEVSVSNGVKNCPECDREACRVVKSMPHWKPAQIKGENVNCYYTIPVEFKIYK